MTATIRKRTYFWLCWLSWLLSRIACFCFYDCISVH